jgi:P27 family predicted phage terminase small subunit
MGKRGPAPKPSALKKLGGTYRNDRNATNEPEPRAGEPNCPDVLTEEAKREWEEKIVELREMGMLTVVDGALLAAYCQAYADWLEALREVKEGRVQKTDTGYEAMRAWQTIYERAEKRMTLLAREFGFSPSARTRISVPGKKPDERKGILGLVG